MLSIDVGRRQVTLDGVHLQLTKTEFDLLYLLATNAGRTIASQALLHEIWGSNWPNDVSSIYVHVCHLRRKLGETPSEPRYVHTVRGVGFRFEAGDSGDSVLVEPPQSQPIDHGLNFLNSAETAVAAVHVVMGTRSFRILWVGGEVQTLLGWTPDHITGRTMWELAHPSDLLLKPALERAVLDTGAVEFNMRIRAPDGNYRPLHTSAKRLTDKDGSEAILGKWKIATHL